MFEFLGTWNKEKQLKRLEKKGKNTYNMLMYYKKEFQKLKDYPNTYNFKNDEDYTKYMDNLKQNIQKYEKSLARITKEIKRIENS